MADTHEMQDGTLAEWLRQADEAYEVNDSKAVHELCGKVLQADPDNARAWGLMAKFGGWDAKMYTLDLDYAIRAAERALSLVPKGERYNAGTEIYTARKRQIAYMLEAEMTMPSHTSAKQLQGTMMDWKRLLEELPYLTSSLIEGEVTLCGNLCLRSKAGIMPGDRLIYTAYATFNGKEPYGETFRKALAARLQRERGRKEGAVSGARALAGEKRAAREEREGAGLPPADEAIKLESDRAELVEALDGVMALSDAAMHEGQVKELERERARLKPYKVFKLREVDARLADVRGKLAQVQAEDERATQPLRDEIAAIDARLRQLSPRG